MANGRIGGVEALTKTGEATVAGIGRSTASKVLATLEADGRARRLSGGRESGRRRPDRWSLAKPAARARSAKTPKPSPTEADKRLRPGALADLVVEYLKANPDEPLGPTAIGKGLQRSQGAVANALARLVETGAAVCVSESPRRYRVPE